MTMSDQERSSPAVPEVSPATETDAPLTVLDSPAPPPLRPETLAEGFQALQQRIPGFVHLTVEEERAKLRVAHLDREFLERSLDAYLEFPDQDMLNWTGDQSQQDWGEIAAWDDVIRKTRIALQGMEGANLERKYAFGSKILVFYAILKRSIRQYPHLRPHLEAMREAYLRARKKSAKRRKKTEEEE